MESFYKNLFKGKTKAEALRSAKIQFIQEAKPENTHPFFWSSYVALGNTQAIAWKTRTLVLLITLSLVAFSALIYLAYKYYKR